MKKPVKVLLIVLAAIALLLVAGAIAFSQSGEKLEALRDIEVTDPDLTQLADGVYRGKHNVFPVLVTVEVTIRDHRMEQIDLVRHINGQGSAAEVIPGLVIETQSLQVDAVAGATYSSKVILLAIEDALLSATLAP